jgi:multidrug resistance efflux pump
MARNRFLKSTVEQLKMDIGEQTSHTEASGIAVEDAKYDISNEEESVGYELDSIKSDVEEYIQSIGNKGDINYGNLEGCLDDLRRAVDDFKEAKEQFETDELELKEMKEALKILQARAKAKKAKKTTK